MNAEECNVLFSRCPCEKFTSFREEKCHFIHFAAFCFSVFVIWGEGWLAVSLLSFYLLRTLLHTMNGNLILDCHGVSKQQQKYYTILHLLFYGPIMAHILHISISSGCNNCSRVVPSLCVREISCFAYSAFKSLVGFNSEIFFKSFKKSHFVACLFDQFGILQLSSFHVLFSSQICGPRALKKNSQLPFLLPVDYTRVFLLCKYL